MAVSRCAFRIPYCMRMCARVCVCVEATCVRDAAVYFCTPSTCLYIQTRAFPASRPYVHTRSQLLCASSAVRFAFKTVHSLFSSPNQKKNPRLPDYRLYIWVRLPSTATTSEPVDVAVHTIGCRFKCFCQVRIRRH